MKHMQNRPKLCQNICYASISAHHTDVMLLSREGKDAKMPGVRFNAFRPVAKTAFRLLSQSRRSAPSL